MNFTDNEITVKSSSQAIDTESLEFRIVKIIFYVVIFVLSCLGNSLVAIVITRTKDLRSSSNVLILNLALCDLLTPAISIPFDLAYEEMHFIWPFGKLMCKLLWPCQTVLIISSTLTLAVISLDRYRALAKPMSGRLSSCQIRGVVVAIHVFSVCLVIPYVIALKYDKANMACNETWPGYGYRQAYTIVLFLFQYAVPLITMTIAYILIYCSLRSNMTSLSSRENPKHKRRTSSMRRASNYSRASTFSSRSIEMRRKGQNIRLAKMFVIVVVVFAVSMFPNQVLWLWVDFGRGAHNVFFPLISALCRLFTYANSVLNPIIYALKSREFRSGFAKIGRKSIGPFRKISNETRRLVRGMNKTATTPTRLASQSRHSKFKDEERKSSSENRYEIAELPEAVTTFEKHAVMKPVRKLATCEIRRNSSCSKLDQCYHFGKPVVNCDTSSAESDNRINEASVNELSNGMAHAQKLLDDLRETDC